MRRPLSLLLVEHDEHDQARTRALLAELEGPRGVITWARTYDEGLQQLIDGHFDVCLLDQTLGDRTGLELLSKALAAGVEVPIILLTEDSDLALGVEATSVGAADYLPRGSINLDSLARSVRHAMDRGRSLSTLRQLGRELEMTRKQAVQANRAKSEFLASVSHAYREPLGTILACSAALQDALGGREPAADGYVREIREAGQRLLDMLVSVLDMHECEAPTPPLELRRLEIVPFVHEIAAAIRPLVGHNENTFELTCPEDIGTLETDPALLGRVLLNLLGNTCKFARRGHLHVVVSRRPARASDLAAGGASELLAQTDCIEVAIRPSGLWMTPAQLELLFAGCPLVETGVAPRGDGSESGISTCRRVCRLLGGELFVATEGPRRPVLRVCVPDRPVARARHSDAPMP